MDQATAIQKYEDALTDFLIDVRSGQKDQLFDLQTRLYEASMDVEPYRETAAYRDAVLRADSRSWLLARPVK